MPPPVAPIVYLDWAATAPLSTWAREAMLPWLTDRFGNPSSLHGVGKRARLAVQDAREAVAALVGAAPSTIVFTSGATEADNLAVRGGAWAAREEHGRRHVLASAIEHPAVLAAHDALKREGFDVERIPVGLSGVVDPEDAARRIGPDTALVSLMAVSNEVGTIQPVAQVAAIARRAGALFHCDAAQAATSELLDIARSDIDLLCLSAHKMGGPQGAGALYVREGLALVPQMRGGQQENQRRAGTENVAALVGFGAVAREVVATRETKMATLRRLERALVDGVISRVRGARRVGTAGCHAPHIASFLLSETDGETLLFALDMAGIAASSGAACSSRTLEPSPVLLAMGFSREEAASAIRFSWGATTTDADVERLLTVLPNLVEQNRHAGRSASPRATHAR